MRGALAPYLTPGGKLPGETGYRGSKLEAVVGAAGKLTLQPKKAPPKAPTWGQTAKGVLAGELAVARSLADPAERKKLVSGALTGAVEGAGRLGQRVVGGILDQTAPGVSDRNYFRVGEAGQSAGQAMERGFTAVGAPPNPVTRALADPAAFLPIDPEGASQSYQDAVQARKEGRYGAYALNTAMMAASMAPGLGPESKAAREGEGLLKAFHATRNDFEHFDPRMAGAANTVGPAERASFFTDTPEAAHSYLGGQYVNQYAPGWDPARRQAAEHRYIALDREANKLPPYPIEFLNRPDMPPHARQAFDQWQAEVKAAKDEQAALAADLKTNITPGMQYPTGANIRPVRIDPTNLMHQDMAGAGYSPEGMQRVLRAADKKGKSGVALHNFNDWGGAPGTLMRPQTTFGILDPKAVRPWWDKAKGYAPIVTTTGLGAGAGALALSSDPAQASGGQQDGAGSYLPSLLGIGGAGALAGVLGTKTGRRLGKSLLANESGAMRFGPFGPKGSEFGFDPYYTGLVGFSQPGDVSRKVAATDLKLPRRIISAEDMQREARGGPIGHVLTGETDRADAGVDLTHVGETPLDQRVSLEGGPDFPLVNPGAAWASGKGRITPILNFMKKNEGPTFYDPYLQQGTGVDYNQMTSLALVNQLHATPEFSRILLDQAVRDFAIKNKQTKQMERPFEGFVGTFKPKQLPELRQQLAQNPALRYWLPKIMDKADFQRKLLLPNVGMTRQAISNPDLLHAPSEATGYNVMRLTGGIVPNPAKTHATYDTFAAGNYYGSRPGMVPINIAQPDFYKRMMAQGRRPDEIGYMLRKQPGGVTAQPITQEYVDLNMKYDEDLKSMGLLGWPPPKAK